ncbi:hypothetical protein ACHAXH_000990 [Discostella pseudostelligera]
MLSTQFQLATATTPSSTTTTAITTTTTTISPLNDASISPSATTSSTTSLSWRNDILHTPNYKLDKIEHIIDASTLRLQKHGIVTLQSVRGAGTTGAGASNNASSLPDNMMHDLIEIEQHARKGGLGIFQSCDDNNHGGDKVVGDGGGDTLVVSNANNNFVAEFEPMEYTKEIQYGDDGGKSVLRRGDGTTTSSSPLLTLPPENQGDIKGCSDFRTYEDALRWYEAYLPYYGDVAKLDRDGDGVPCPGLPHTTLREQYRMKKRVTYD